MREIGPADQDAFMCLTPKISSDICIYLPVNRTLFGLCVYRPTVDYAVL